MRDSLCLHSFVRLVALLGLSLAAEARELILSTGVVPTRKVTAPVFHPPRSDSTVWN